MGWNEGGLNPKVNCLGFNPLHPTPFHLVLKKTEQDLTCFHDSSCSGFIAIIGKKCYSILGNIKYHLKLTHGNAKNTATLLYFCGSGGREPCLPYKEPDRTTATRVVLQLLPEWHCTSRRGALGYGDSVEHPPTIIKKKARQHKSQQRSI